MPVDHARDGNSDCLGATDERKRCRQTQSSDLTPYRCWNDRYCVLGERFGSLACSSKRNPSRYLECINDPEIEAVFNNLMSDDSMEFKKIRSVETDSLSMVIIHFQTKRVDMDGL